MGDRRKPGYSGRRLYDQQAQVRTPLDAVTNGKVTLPRGPESVTDRPIIWADAALDEFDSAESKVVQALRKLAVALTTIRGAKTVTEIEVRDALSRIVVGLPQSKWVRLGRISSVVAIFFGGAGLSYGFQQSDAVISVLSVAFGLLLVVFEELLLKYKKYP